MALLSAPLTLVRGLAAAESKKWDINDTRRANLAQKKHFLVRGTEWLDLAEITVADLHRSGHAHGLFAKIRTFGPAWVEFSDRWNVERGDGGKLGKNIVGEYLSNNQRDRYLNPLNVDTRYLTLYRAVGLVAFLHLFAKSWFNDERKGRGRRRKLTEGANADYDEDFVFDRTTIEPVIFKVGSLGSAYNEELMGVDWQDPGGYDPSEIRPNQAYLTAFRNAIDLPWTDAIDTAEIVKGLFIQERCADLAFMARVAKFTGEFFSAAPPTIRSGSDFKGPSAGILYQRFIDIRTTTQDGIALLPPLAGDGEGKTEVA